MQRSRRWIRFACRNTCFRAAGTSHEEFGDKATIWDSPDGTKEVWVPRNARLRDFKKLVMEAFSVLSDVEQRAPQAILSNLSLSWADLARFRVDTGILGASAIPLSDGVRLVKTARDVILSGARWLIEPRAAYYSRPLGSVSRFLRTLQLGQTEVGNYVVTVISPLGGTETAPDFARHLMKQVLNSVDATRDAAMRAYNIGDIVTFDDAVARGVNANLCDALANLAEASPTNSIEVSFRWSERLYPGQEESRAIVIDSRLVQTLRPAPERLLNRARADVTIRGLVQTLHDSTDVQHQSDATIVGKSMVGLEKFVLL